MQEGTRDASALVVKTHLRRDGRERRRGVEAEDANHVRRVCGRTQRVILRAYEQERAPPRRPSPAMVRWGARTRPSGTGPIAIAVISAPSTFRSRSCGRGEGGGDVTWRGRRRLSPPTHDETALVAHLKVHDLAARERERDLALVAARAHDRPLAGRPPLGDPAPRARAPDVAHARRVDLQRGVEGGGAGER